MKTRHDIISTLLTTTAVLILVIALPSAIVDTFETGRVYLFSRQFLDELPQRLTGPGRLRFAIQPLIAIVLGWRGGIGDVNADRQPYLYSLVTGAGDRKELLKSGIKAIRNLFAMGIILDALAQFFIYGKVHPGAAVIFGPVLICLPYSVSRALTNRLVRLVRRHDWMR